MAQWWAQGAASEGDTAWGSEEATVHKGEEGEEEGSEKEKEGKEERNSTQDQGCPDLMGCGFLDSDFLVSAFFLFLPLFFFSCQE